MRTTAVCRTRLACFIGLFVAVSGCVHQSSSTECMLCLRAGMYEKDAGGSIPELVTLIERRETEKLIDVLEWNPDPLLSVPIAEYFTLPHNAAALTAFRSRKDAIARVQGEFYVVQTLLRGGDKSELWTAFDMYKQWEYALKKSDGTLRDEIRGRYAMNLSSVRMLLAEVTQRHFLSLGEFEAWLHAQQVQRPPMEP